MSDWLRTVFNNIKITPRPDGWVISGIRTRPFFSEVRRVYGTTRFENGIAQNVLGSSFTISTFFLYDFYNVVKGIEENGTRYFRQEIIAKLVEELEKIEPIKRITERVRSKLVRSELERFPVTPLESQDLFFKTYDERTQQYGLNGYILAVPPGGGKTFSSLMLQAMLKKDIIFVFSPANAINEVWRKSIDSIEGANVWAYGDTHATTGYTHYVFSHENTNYALALIIEIIKDNPRANIGIIVDECHRFTEISSQMTINLIDICQRSQSKDIIFMSGTPFKAMGRELIPFIKATDPTFTLKDEEGFKKIFGVSGNQAREILAARIGRTLFRVDKASIVKNDITEYLVKVTVPNGLRFTLPEIKKKMKAFVMERHLYYKKHGPEMCRQFLDILANFRGTLKSQSDIERFNHYFKLIEIIRNTKNLMDVPEEIKESNAYERKVIIPALSPSDKKIFRDTKSVYKYLHLKIQGEALGRILGTERMACNLEIIKHIDNGRIYSEKAGLDGVTWAVADIFATSKSKTVMFSDFIEVLKEMESKMKKDGYSPALVYGDTNSDLTGIIEKFEKDPKTNPVIATYKSLSTGVPLVMSDSCVLLNAPFRDYIMQQTTSRIDRLGQPHPIHIYTYQLDTGGIPNVSTRSKDIMDMSKKMVEELLGVTAPTQDEILEDEYVMSLSNTKKDKSLNFFSSWK